MAQPRAASVVNPATLFGLINRRERWGLTLRGWLLLGFSAFGLSALCFLGVHPFLAITHRIPSDVLIVEGWISTTAIKEASKEFHAGNYKRIITVGGPVGGYGEDAADDDTYAYVAMMKLRKAGIKKELIEMVPAHRLDRDRTYGSALALRQFFEKAHVLPQSFTVVTMGAHARRSLLLFQKAFETRTSIGIVSVENPLYPPSRWWKYSEGVKEVISESAAYLYVRLFFWP